MTQTARSLFDDISSLVVDGEPETGEKVDATIGCEAIVFLENARKCLGGDLPHGAASHLLSEPPCQDALRIEWFSEGRTVVLRVLGGGMRIFVFFTDGSEPVEIPTDPAFLALVLRGLE